MEKPHLDSSLTVGHRHGAKRSRFENVEGTGTPLLRSSRVLVNAMWLGRSFLLTTQRVLLFITTAEPSLRVEGLESLAPSSSIDMRSRRSDSRQLRLTGERRESQSANSCHTHESLSKYLKQNFSSEESSINTSLLPGGLLHPIVFPVLARLLPEVACLAINHALPSQVTL